MNQRARRFPEYGLLDHSDLMFKRTTGSTESGEWLAVVPFPLVGEVLGNHPIKRYCIRPVK